MSGPGARLAQVYEHLAAGRVTQALAVASRLAQAHPSDGAVCDAASIVLVHTGQHEKALHFAERAAARLPEVAGVRARLAQLLGMLGRAGEGIVHAQRAVELEPDSPSHRVTLAAVLAAVGRYCDARDICAEGRRRSPGADDPNLLASHAHALLSTGRADQAVGSYREGVARHPANLLLLSNLCNASNYDSMLSAPEVRAIHDAYGTAAPRPPAPGFRNSPDPDRPLAVGVASPDLRSHSVSYFIEPWLERHDRATVSITAYSTSSRHDRVSERLKGHVARWRDAATWGDDEFAARVRGDGIDVLIDLAGHTVGASLGMLARAPAPVVASYCGYPNVTGLGAVGWRLVDSITDPPRGDGGGASGSSSIRERPLLLDPCFLCYRPPADAPDVSTRGGDGPATFASFNAIQKLTDPLVAAWARILRAVPGSRLLLKAQNLEDPRLPDELRARFADAGAPSDAIEFLRPTSGVAEHLASYARADVALDTFPYHGTTTTCEAMWMGVPVVTLAGDRHASRVGVSLLHATGLAELVARDWDSYVSLGVGLAGGVARRRAWRAGLRGMMAASPLMDEAAFARRFDGALRAAWGAWCRGS